jgi:DNA-binding LacI/PurR family transcriptional regulator
LPPTSKAADSRQHHPTLHDIAAMAGVAPMTVSRVINDSGYVTTPPLTTAEQPTAEQGREAARMLLERVGQVAGLPRRNVSVDCRLIVRESTVQSARTLRSHA